MNLTSDAIAFKVGGPSGTAAFGARVGQRSPEDGLTGVRAVRSFDGRRRGLARRCRGGAGIVLRAAPVSGQGSYPLGRSNCLEVQDGSPCKTTVPTRLTAS